jgi:hypothetical protein
MPNLPTIAITSVRSVAVGPETTNGAPLIHPTRIPPIIDEIRPEVAVMDAANATPIESGKEMEKRPKLAMKSFEIEDQSPSFPKELTFLFTDNYLLKL